jgi:hypothetical protein
MWGGSSHQTNSNSSSTASTASTSKMSIKYTPTKSATPKKQQRKQPSQSNTMLNYVTTTSSVPSSSKKDYAFPTKTSATSTESSTGDSTPGMTWNIYCIGYGGTTPQQFEHEITVSGITHLVDIRISPYSGFNKEFNSERLATLLFNVKPPIQYIHMVELGNVFKGDTMDPLLGDVPYVELIASGAGEILTRRLRGLVENGRVSGFIEPKDDGRERRVCIMCACKDYHFCHRYAVSGYLQANHNYNVLHLEPLNTSA